jgi:hypothetical protein
MLAAAGPVGDVLSSPKERQAMFVAGQCIVSERVIEVRKLLATDFRDESYGRMMRKLVNKKSWCAGYTVPPGVYSAGGLLWGGTLAEGLLRRDKILDDLAARTAYRPDLPNIEARNGGEYVAFCAIRTYPNVAASLLRAEPATDEESEAFKALGPIVSACVPKDTKAEFTPDALRALLALGAYRLAMHNSQPAPATRERG